MLLRMLDPEGNTIGPDRFLSAALRYQMMPTIDRWVIATVIEMLRPRRELLANAPVCFTINFSGQSLHDEEFADYVIRSIETSRINPAVFCFELTESAAVASINDAREAHAAPRASWAAAWRWTISAPGCRRCHTCDRCR